MYRERTSVISPSSTPRLSPAIRPLNPFLSGVPGASVIGRWLLRCLLSAGLVAGIGPLLAAPPPPPNDDFVNRFTLTGERVVEPVELAGATVEAFEGTIVSEFNADRSVWWRWVAPRSGIVTLTLVDQVSRSGGNPNTPQDSYSACGLTVAKGTPPSGFTVVASESSVRHLLFSQVSIQAEAGTEYQIRADAIGLHAARFILNLAYNAAPQIIIEQPGNTSEFNLGDVILLAARCLDPDNPVSNVRFYVANQFGAVQTMLTTPPFATNWTPVIPSRYRILALAEDAAGGVRAAIPVSIEVRPANDQFFNRFPLQGDSFDTTGWIQNATGDKNEDAATIPNVWWRWTAPRNGPFTIVADNTPGYYPRLDVFTVGSPGQLQVVASKTYDGLAGVPYQASVTFGAVAGMEYAISVSSSGGECALKGVYSQPPEVVLTAPANQSSVTAPTPVWLEAEATDPDDGIARVEFWMDFQLLGSVTHEPFRLLYDTSGQGNIQHRLTARAIDHHGLTTVSAERFFVVNAQPAPPPNNDDFADRTPLRGPVLQGTTYMATREPGEPGTGGASVWWSWLADLSGRQTLLLQAAAEFAASAYKGASLQDLRLVATSRRLPDAPIESGFEMSEYELVFDADAGTAYSIQVENSRSDSFVNSFMLSHFPGTRPTVELVRSPPDSPIANGNPVTLSVTARDADGIVTRVTLKGLGLNSTNVIFTQPPYVMTLASLPEGYYRFEVTATDDTGLVSAPSYTEFQVQPPTPTPPPGDLFTERIPISGAPITESATLANSRSQSIWYAWTPSKSEPHTITFTSEVGRYPRLYIWKGTELHALTPVAEAIYLGTSSELDYTARAILEVNGGETYLLQLNAGNFGAGYTLDIQATLPPEVQIVAPAANQAVHGATEFVIRAEASDPEGAVRRVECFYDRVSLGSLEKPPYAWTVKIRDSSAVGHTIRVDVYDDHGVENLAERTVVVYPPPPVNDRFADAEEHTGFAWNSNGWLSGAGVEPGEPGTEGPAGSEIAGASVWFAWEAPANGTATVALAGSGAAFDVYASPTGHMGDLVPIVRGAYQLFPSESNQRSWNAKAGVPYRISVRAAHPEVIGYDLRLFLIPDRAGTIEITEVEADGVRGFRVRITGLPGAQCVLEASSDLVHWEPVAEGWGETLEFLQAEVTGSGERRFYRTRTLP